MIIPKKKKWKYARLDSAALGTHKSNRISTAYRYFCYVKCTGTIVRKKKKY